MPAIAANQLVEQFVYILCIRRQIALFLSARLPTCTLVYPQMRPEQTIYQPDQRLISVSDFGISDLPAD